MSKTLQGKIAMDFTAVRLENMSLVENAREVLDFCETNPPFIDIDCNGKLRVYIPQSDKFLLVGSGDYVVKIFDKLMVFTADEYNEKCL